MTHKHLGTAELAALLNLSRQRIHVLRSHDDFPKPADELSCGPIWHEADVRGWMRARKPGLGGRPAKQASPPASGVGRATRREPQS